MPNVFPALKASMGTWEYYTIKMSMKELSASVQFAKDIYDEHIQCLQCGYMKDVNDESEALSIITGASHSGGTLSEATQPPGPTRMVG